jgi:hypothetical protein
MDFCSSIQTLPQPLFWEAKIQEMQQWVIILGGDLVLGKKIKT